MLYKIRIGNKDFDMNETAIIESIFKYCESQFSFNGEEWEKIKEEFDYESMGELIRSRGVEYQEYIE